MLVREHLEFAILPAIADYESAELDLSGKATGTDDETCWKVSGMEARRRAAQLAVAMDGLVDRCELEFGGSKKDIRKEFADNCETMGRSGASHRIFAVANVYKHQLVDPKRHPIRSWEEVLVVGTGYGVDGFGIGKNGSPEVLVRELNSPKLFKFLGDVPAVYQAAIWFLTDRGEIYSKSEVILSVQIRAQR